MLKRLLLLIALLLPMPAMAAADSLTGSWALKLDGAVIMRFDLQPDGAGWKGAWVKPTSFASDGKRFGKIAMPPVERKSDKGATIGDWAEITFNDPRPGAEPDVFRFHLTGTDRAEMIYVGTGLAPYTLQRVPAATPLGPFQDGKVYGGGGTPAAPAARQLGRPTGQPAPRPTPNAPPVQGPPAIIGR